MIRFGDSAYPPRFWEAVLALFAPERFRDQVVGDLREEFAEVILPESGPYLARRWYRSQVLRSTWQHLGVHIHDIRSLLKGRRKGGVVMGYLIQDLRQGFRGARGNPLVAVVIVLTLSIGIGANTLVYSTVDSLIFNPFSFPEPQRLITIGTEFPRLNRPVTYREHMSPAEYTDIRDQSRTIRDLVAWDMGNRPIATSDAVMNVLTGFWWGDAFQPLEVIPALGRGFSPDEIARGENVAVVSHRIWTNNFAADPGFVGTTLQITGNPYTVIGVMPEGTLLSGMDLWIPMTAGPERFSRGPGQFQVLGRIAEGSTMEDVAAELEGLARRTEQAYGAEFEAYQGFHLVPATWAEANFGQFHMAANLLLAAVASVLLLVCANIASLLLARSATRRHEMAVRTAMGAGRGRLVRQLLTESVTLSLLGGLVGVGIAYFGIQKLGGFVQTLPFIGNDVVLNSRAMWYTVFVSVGAGVVFGLIPALQASKGSLRGVLSTEGGANTGNKDRRLLQRWFVGVEVSMAILLLVGGGLLINSLVRLSNADPGFDHRNVLTMRLTLPWQDYQDDQIAMFFEGLAEQVRAIPGVTEATVGSQFSPIAFSRSRLEIQGSDPVDEGQLPTSLVTQVGDRYFDALGIPLLKGRVQGPRDSKATPLTGVVNQIFVDRYLPGLEPLGQRLRIFGQDTPWIEIVGVVGDTHNRGLATDPEPEIFASVRQLSGTNNQLFLILRTSVEPYSVMPDVRRVVREFDADQPIYRIGTIEETFSALAAPQSAAAVSLAIFALFALILAALGIYAVVAISVGERTREIGLRMALGARPDVVRGMVIRQAMMPVAVGAMVGLVASGFAGRAMASMLYEIESYDPATLAGVVVILVAVAFFASWLPARRASMIDPSESLRQN